MLLKKILAIIFLLLLLSLTACGSLVMRSQSLVHEAPYPVVQQEVENIAYAFTGKEGSARALSIWLLPVMIIDLPFSLVLDTLFLPFDLAHRADKPGPVE